MPLFALILALLPGTALAEEPRPRASDDAFAASPLPGMCRDPRDGAALPKGKPLKPRRLDEEPAATGYYAVLRIEDGCNAPVRVNEDRGGATPWQR